MRPIRRSRRAVRGVTLLELMVVLGILLAVAALALPLAVEAAQRRRFDSSVDELVGMLRLSRAHARLESATVEVVLLAGRDGSRHLEARVVDFADLALEVEESAGQPIAGSWAWRRFDAEIAVPRSGEEGAERGQREDLDGILPLRLVLFASDGSAPLAERIVLRDGAGREARVRVEPWTGQVVLEHLGAEIPQADEEPSDALADGERSPRG